MMAKEKQAFRQFLVGSGPGGQPSWDHKTQVEGIGDEIFEVWRAKAEQASWMPRTCKITKGFAFAAHAFLSSALS